MPRPLPSVPRRRTTSFREDAFARERKATAAKPGPKPKPPEETLTARQTVMTTPGMAAFVEKFAERDGITPPEWIRRAISYALTHDLRFARNL